MPNMQKPSRNGVHSNYDAYQDSAIADQRLNRMLVAKALNLPYDEMRDIKVTNGIGAKGIAAIALATALPGLGLAGVLAWNLLKPVTEKIIEKPPVVIDNTRKVRVETELTPPQ